jgi:hypothetical protein
LNALAAAAFTSACHGFEPFDASVTMIRPECGLRNARFDPAGAASPSTVN